MSTKSKTHPEPWLRDRVTIGRRGKRHYVIVALFRPAMLDDVPVMAFVNRSGNPQSGRRPAKVKRVELSRLVLVKSKGKRR